MTVMKQIDWQSYAGVSAVLLRWTPEEFWRATPVEFFSAIQAYQRYVLGLSPSDGAGAQDLARLTALFPDT
jgi:uncharacterized phage protein (TIGR02216 family)